MLHKKILGFSTAIILASCLIEGNGYPSFASNLEHKISESHNSYQIAQARTYRVRLGDTLGGIANRFGISFSQLLNYNPQLRSRPNLIYVGESINVGGGASSPSTSPPPSKGRKYTVRRGDTLGGIAIRHGLSLSTILAYNPHLASRPNSINVGERINVGSSQIIRRTPTNQPIPSPTSPPPSTSSRRPVTFRGLPTTRRQGSNSIGAIRGNKDEACTKAGENMRAIAPENGLGFTFDDYPYFFWYFPGVESDSVPVIFTLIGQKTREVNGRTRTRATKVYEQELKLDQSGIIAFALPPESEPLKEEQEYQWRIQINCTPQTTMFLKYSIKRQSTDNPALVSKLETAPVDQYPLIFAESGVWFDALKIISLQLQQAPGDPILEQDWQNVLELIGFNDLIGEPIQHIQPNIQ